MSKIQTLLTAGIGQGALVVTETAAQAIEPTEVASIGQLIIQIVIGIVTLWKLVKKPKPKND
jgi:hypothetical protein